MKNRWNHMRRLLTRNIRTLFLFEIFYRLLGLLVILPLTRQLISLSIRFYEKEYIINMDLIDYVLSPSTIIIYLFLSMVFGVYLIFEIVVLSLLFHKSENNQDVSFKSLILAGLRRTKQVIRRHHIVMILSVFVFLSIIEVFHIAGIASTIRIPPMVQVIIDNVPYLRRIFALSIIGLFLVFGATVFFEVAGIHRGGSIKEAFRTNFRLLRKRTWRIYAEFFLINAILNIIIYGVYMAVVGLAALVISVFYSTSAVFGIILTILYTVFVIVGFLFTIILMPVNYAWINSLYYDREPKHNQGLDRVFQSSDKKHWFENKRLVKQVIAVVVVIIFSVNVFTVVDLVANPAPPIQALQKPMIIAHRGSSGTAPENTLAAIEKAILDGADAVEVDVRFTKDDVPVLMHDETVERTTDVSGGSLSLVRELTLDEIKRLDAGSWFDNQYAAERVPTLEEALRLARGRIDVYIEVKSSIKDTSVILTDIIEKTRMTNRVKILSFNGVLLENIKQENQSITIIQLIGTFLGNINVLADNELVDAYGFGISILKNNENYMRAMKQQGKAIYVYTVNDAEDIKYANRIGVDGIITDEPYLARELVYSSATNDVFDKIMASLFQR